MDAKIQAVFDFLTNEGFRPIYEDGYILFKCEGDNYIIVFKEDDEDYKSIGKYITLDINGGQLFAVYRILNEVNSRYILGKCLLGRGDNKDVFLHIQLESLESIDSFQKNFMRYLGIIVQMQIEFGQKLNKISQ